MAKRKNRKQTGTTTNFKNMNNHVFLTMRPTQTRTKQKHKKNTYIKTNKQRMAHIYGETKEGI